MILRPAEAADHEAIHAITTAAFGRAVEAKIILGVRSEGAALIELVAAEGDALIAHILFSAMRCDPPRRFAALGPVAVSPQRQRKGAGSALIRAGIEACRGIGMEAIVLLGHPTYYPRFGFSCQAAQRIESPYAGSRAFMALELRDGALASPLRADYPAAFG